MVTATTNLERAFLERLAAEPVARHFIAARFRDLGGLRTANRLVSKGLAFYAFGRGADAREHLMLWVVGRKEIQVHPTDALLAGLGWASPAAAGNDAEDFRDLSRWQVCDALRQAFDLGRAAGSRGPA